MTHLLRPRLLTRESGHWQKYKVQISDISPFLFSFTTKGNCKNIKSLKIVAIFDISVLLKVLKSFHFSKEHIWLLKVKGVVEVIIVFIIFKHDDY